MRFRGLRACAVPGEHIYRIDPTEFEELVRAFRTARFFDIPRLDDRRAMTDAGVITIGYRDGRRVHETVAAGRRSELTALAARLKAAGRIERLVDPTADIYREFLQSGWNVNSTGQDDENALYCAVLKERLDAVRVLLDHGAMVSEHVLRVAAAANVGILAVVADAAHLDLRSRVASEMLVHAAASSRGTLEYLLDRGVDAKAADADESALMSAITSASLQNAALLLSRGAHPDWTNRSGRIALHVAAVSTNSGFITLLAKHGADVNSIDREGRTPLMHAAERCFDWNVRALLQAGAEPALRNRDGRTAADAASQNTSGQQCGTTRALLAEPRR